MDDFPDDVRRFLHLTISSVFQLEALLLLRASPERGRGAAQLAQAIYTDAGAVEEKLAELRSHGLVRADEGPGRCYHYDPASPELARLVDRLADLYHERRVAVIAQIYSRTPDQIQAFTDAGELRKET